MDISTFSTVFLPIAVVQFVGWATPGPNHLTIITAAVTGGRGVGLRAAFGVASGAFLWALIAVSGIAVIFELFPPVYVGIRLLGAGYLIYLGVNAFRSVRSGGVFRLEPDAASPVTTAPFRTAFVVMMTNPKAVLFFGSIVTAFIPPDGPNLLMLLIVLQIGLMGMMLNGFGALFFSSPPVIRAFMKAGRSMSVLFGVLFCGLGLLVLWDAVAG